MFRRLLLRNGKIPANTECPWKGNCTIAKNLECRHVGINKLRDFNCPHAVSNEAIDAVGSMPINNKESKKKFEYCVSDIASAHTKESLREMLNTKGALGWELCGKEYGFFIFKREIV